MNSMKYDTLFQEIKRKEVTRTASDFWAQCKKRDNWCSKGKEDEKCAKDSLKMCNKWALMCKQQGKRTFYNDSW